MLSELGEHIEALRRDPTSSEAAKRVREGARADGALSLYAEAFADRARVLASKGLKDEAIASLIEAALVYEEELDDLEGAASLYQRVLDLDPAHRRAMFALGLLLHDLGRFQDLIELYRRRFDRSSDDGERTTLLLYVAETLSEKLGDDRGAFEEVMKAARLAPKNLRIITRLERLGERTGRAGEVAVVIGDLMLHQTDPRVRAGLALRLAELYMGPLNEPKRALVYFKSALDEDGADPEILSEVEDAFRERERFDDLAELLEHVAGERRTGPQRVRLERELARIYELELGDKKRALAALTNAARNQPDDRDLLDEVMRLGLSIGALDVVAQTFEDVCGETRNALLRTYLRLKLGHIYGGVLQRPSDAIRAYEAILAEDPAHKEARRRLGNLCERVGDWTRLAALAEEEARLAEPQSGSSQPASVSAPPPAPLPSSPPPPRAPSPPRPITDLSRVGVSKVAADAPSEAWTEIEGEPFGAGPEAETQWDSLIPSTPQYQKPNVVLNAPDESDQDQMLEAMTGPPVGDLLMALDDGPFEEETQHATGESSIPEEEILDEDDVIYVRPSTSGIMQPEPPPEPEMPIILGEPPLRGRSPSPVPLIPSAPPPPLAEPPAPPEAELDLEELPPIDPRAKLEGLQEMLRADGADEPALLAEMIAAHEALGEHEKALFSQVKLARLDPREEQWTRVLELGKKARAFGATIASVGESLPKLPLEAQLRLGLALAELEAGEANDPQAALQRLEALYQLAPDEPLIFAFWTEQLEAKSEFARLAQVLENEARRVSDPWETRALLRRAAEVRATKLLDPGGAANVLSSWLAHRPEDDEVAADSAKYLEAAGRWRDLISQLEAQLWRSVGPQRSAVRRHIARIAIEHLNDPAAAERMLRLALSEMPDDRDALDQLVAMHSVAGEWDQVIEVLTGQLPLVTSPKDRSALRREIAEVAEKKLGNVEMARAQLERALSDDSSDLAAIEGLERLRRATEDWPGVVEALIMGASAARDPKISADRWVEAARVRKRELGDPHGACAAYREALAIKPDHLIALAELGETSEEIGDASGAVDAFRRSAEMLEGLPRATAHLRAGRLLERALDQPDESAREYERAIEADAACVDALGELARWNEQRGKLDMALDLSEREADLTTDDRRRAALWLRTAELARHGVKDAPRALVAYRRALDADPDDINTEAALGELSLAAGDSDRAFTHLSRAARGLKRSDGLRAVDLYIMAGQAAERLGNREQAIASYDSALEIAPRSREGLSRLSMLMASAKLWERAYELSASLLLNHEAALEPAAASQVYLRMAESKRALNDRAAAIRLGKKAHSLDPEAVAPLDLLADSLEEEGETIDAADMLRRRAALTRDELDRRSILIRAAKLLGAAGELGKAVAILGELHAVASHDVEVAELLAEYRERSGELRGAASALATAARTLEGRPRADLLVRAGRVAAGAPRDRLEARALLAEAMDVSPTHREGLRELAIMLELEREYGELAKLYERAGREFLQDAFTGQDAHDGDRNAAADRCFEAAKMLFRFRLSRPLDALRVIRAQREIDGERDDLREDLARVLEEAAPTVDAAAGLAMRGEALDLWAELVEAQPGLLDGLRRIYSLRLDRGERVLARVAAELIEVLGSSSLEEQRIFEQELGGDRAPLLPHLGAPPAVDVPPAPEENTVLEPLFSQLGYSPLIAFEDAMPEPQLRRRDRVSLSSLGVLAGPAIDETCTLFGVDPPVLFARDDAPLPIAPAFSDGKPALIVSLALASKLTPAQLRFHAGRSLSLLRSRALAVSILPLEVLREGLEGLVMERGNPELLFSDIRRSKRRGKALQRELAPSARISLLSQLAEWMIKPNRSTLFEEREAVYRTAERAGLIACGSLKAAITVLAAGGRPERRWLFALVRFAASRQYAEIAAHVAR